MTIAPINSRRFIEALFLRFSGIKYRHAGPCMVYPPMPNLHESEYVVDEGATWQMLLMLTPFRERWVNMSFQSTMSSRSQGANFILKDSCAFWYFCSLYRKRVRKYRDMCIITPV